MTIYTLHLFGHTIRFGDDGPYDGQPLWKSDVDNTGWTPGQPDLSAELQGAILDATPRHLAGQVAWTRS